MSKKKYVDEGQALRHETNNAAQDVVDLIEDLQEPTPALDSMTNPVGKCEGQKRRWSDKK